VSCRLKEDLHNKHGGTLTRAGDLKLLATHSNDVLALQELLGNQGGQTAHQVAAAVDDDRLLKHHFRLPELKEEMAKARELRRATTATKSTGGQRAVADHTKAKCKLAPLVCTTYSTHKCTSNTSESMADHEELPRHPVRLFDVSAGDALALYVQ
jgi:hypothetical protein